MVQFRAASADERVEAARAAFKDGDCGLGLPPHGVPCLTVMVRHNGGDRPLWLRSAAVRGGWVADAVTAACRTLFGEARGTCRGVQGEAVLEFRPFWPTPAPVPVVESVPLTVVLRDGVTERDDVFRCSTAVMPGGDVESVILASCYQACSRRYGHGDVEWVRGDTNRIRYRATGLAAAAGAVPMRFTVHRGGGRPTDVVVMVPYRRAGTWSHVCEALSAECRTLFGVGRLEYMPEVGETHFRWA